MKRRTVFIGLFYFTLFSFLFFAFMYGMTRLGFDPDSEWGGGEEQIALVRVEGIITSSEEITKILARSEKNDRIKAILLRIDSPGGAVVPSQEIYDAVKKIRELGEKKVVTSMGTVAASGGYYIASASNFVMANPGTLTGSLGVIMELPNIEGLLQKVGVETIVIKSGPNKDAGSPFRKMTTEEKALFQNLLDDVHDQFIKAVAEGRSLPVEEVKTLADGRIFTGRQAKTVGLVDGLGNLEDAVQKAKELAGIRGEAEVVETQKECSFFKMLQSQFWGQAPYFLPMRFSYLMSF